MAETTKRNKVRTPVWVKAVREVLASRAANKTKARQVRNMLRVLSGAGLPPDSDPEIGMFETVSMLDALAPESRVCPECARFGKRLLRIVENVRRVRGLPPTPDPCAWDATLRPLLFPDMAEVRGSIEAAQQAKPEAKPRDFTPIANPFEVSIAVRVSQHVWGVRRKVYGSEVRVTATASKDDVTKAISSMTKKLIECDEYAAIVQADRAIKEWIRNRSLPCPPSVSESTYLVRLDQIAATRDRLRAYLETERPQLIEAFLNRYTSDLLPEQQARLGALFDAQQYPSAADVRARFWAEISYPPLNAGARVDQRLASIDQAAYYEAMREAEASVAAAAAEARDILRASVLELVGSLTDALTRTQDNGRPGVLRGDIVERLRDAVELFDVRNLTQDASLGDAVGRLRGILDGVDRESLSDNVMLRAETARRIATVQAELQSLVVPRASRAIDLSDE